jgi:hypothetical protein
MFTSLDLSKKIEVLKEYEWDLKYNTHWLLPSYPPNLNDDVINRIEENRKKEADNKPYKPYTKKYDECSGILIRDLLSKNVNNFIIIEGYIKFNSHQEEIFHTWIELSDKKIVDPSKERFIKWGLNTDKIEYIKVEKKYKPEEYLKLYEKLFKKGT